MLTTVNRNILLYFLIAIIIIAVVVVLSGTIWAIIKSNREGNSIKIKVIITSVLCIVIAGVSWILNFGWIRFIMTFMLIPFIHAIVFFLINLFTSFHINKSNNLKLFNFLYCITYLLAYLFLPDGGDVGGMYVFFGLIHSDWFVDISGSISTFAFICNIVLSVLQIIYLLKARKTNLINTEK